MLMEQSTLQRKRSDVFGPLQEGIWPFLPFSFFLSLFVFFFNLFSCVHTEKKNKIEFIFPFIFNFSFLAFMFLFGGADGFSASMDKRGVFSFGPLMGGKSSDTRTLKSGI